MNKKLLLVVLSLAVVLLAVPIVGMAAADSGQTKQDFKFELRGSSARLPNGYYWISDEGIFQARDYSFIPSFMRVTVGEDILTPVGYSASMDLMLNLTSGHGTIRINETLTFADGGTLEIRVSEILWNYRTPEYYGKGSFVGFGSGTLEGVKVQGSSGADIVGGSALITREGTVSGWP